jgi:hypothetical protein
MKKDSMLAKLIGSVVGVAPEATVVASEATAALQAEFEAFKAEASATQLELSEALTKALAAVGEADTAVAAAQAQVADLTAQLATFKEQVEAARLAARKEKIEAAVGTDRADALMESTKDVPDASFEAVVAALKVSADLEGKSKMFTAQGADGTQPDAPALVAESETMKIVKQRVKAGLHTAA